MNILPIVFSLLLVLGILSSMLTQSSQHTQILSIHCSRFMHMKRSLESELASRAFRQNRPRKQRDTSTPARQPRVFRRPEIPRTESSKINLSRKYHQQLQTILPLLIDDLYGHTSFFQKENCTRRELSTTLAKSLLQKLLDTPQPLLLTDLHPTDPSLAEIYYNMLKITPAFSDYVFIAKNKQRKPVCFRKATQNLLSIILGTQVAESVFKQESEKNRPLRESELRQLLSHSPHAGTMDQLISIMQFHSNANEQQHIVKKSDPRSGTTLLYEQERVVQMESE